MQRLNKRIQRKKEPILEHLALGFPETAIAKVYEIDARTLRKYIEYWKQEDAKEDSAPTK